MTVGVIILAAGLSRRMGTDKLTSDLGGKPVLAHVIDAVEAAGLPMILVDPPSEGEGDRRSRWRGSSIFGGSLPANTPPPRFARSPSPSGGGFKVVEVPDHALGMGHSIAAAVRAVPREWSAALVCLGDMPFVTPATFRALAQAAGEDRVIAPVHEGQRGNPLAWGRAFFADLAQLKGDTGGRALLGEVGDRLVLLAVDDPGILIDIDTPEALAEAQSRLARCSR